MAGRESTCSIAGEGGKNGGGGWGGNKLGLFLASQEPKWLATGMNPAFQSNVDLF